MNWAKRLLQPHNDVCGYPEGDHVVCDVCGRIVDADGEYPTCPVCGVALCGDEECANRHVAEHHPEWGDDDDDADDGPACDYRGRDIDPDAGWTLETRDGTERFCCAECRDERAAEIEAAPLCAWCHEKCDQSVVRLTGNPAPFCSTDCAAKFRASSATDRCDDCGRDGDCDGCPGHPKATTIPPEVEPEDLPFAPIKPMTALDRAYLASDSYKDTCRAAFIDAFGNRYALFRGDGGQEVWPAEDGSLWVLTNDLQWVKLTTYWHVDAPLCARCGKTIYGPRYISSRYPELKFCSKQCRDDYASNPFRDDYAELHG